MDRLHGAEAARAFSIADLVKRLPVGRSTIYEEIRAGRLRAVKLGSRTLVLDHDLSAWLNNLPERPP